MNAFTIFETASATKVKLKPGRKALAEGTYSPAAEATRARIAKVAKALVADDGIWPSPAAVNKADPKLSVGNVGHHPDVLDVARRAWVKRFGPHPHWSDPLIKTETRSTSASGDGLNDEIAVLKAKLELEIQRVRRLEQDVKERDLEIARRKKVEANLLQINERLMKGMRPALPIDAGDGGPPPV